MSYASRRLRKLQGRLLDESGLAPDSPEWYAYWLERCQQHMGGDHNVDLSGATVEVIRMWMQHCDDNGAAEQFRSRTP